MNYHSFRESDKRSSREVSIENLETDSLEISGSQLTVLPPSEASRRSRLSDIFPDILNFKSLGSGERNIPSPDYPNSSLEKSLSTISEQECEKTCASRTALAGLREPWSRRAARVDLIG